MVHFLCRTKDVQRSQRLGFPWKCKLLLINSAMFLFLFFVRGHLLDLKSENWFCVYSALGWSPSNNGSWCGWWIFRGHFPYSYVSWSHKIRVSLPNWYIDHNFILEPCNHHLVILLFITIRLHVMQMLKNITHLSILCPRHEETEYN